MIKFLWCFTTRSLVPAHSWIKTNKQQDIQERENKSEENTNLGTFNSVNKIVLVVKVPSSLSVPDCELINCNFTGTTDNSNNVIM